MKRKYILTAFMAAAAVMLGGCQGGSANEAAEIFEDEPITIMQSESNETGQEDTTEQGVSDFTYEDLNNGSLYCLYDDAEQREYIEIKQEFQEVKYDGDIVPPELVREAEKILQYSIENKEEPFFKIDWESWIKEMGSELYSVPVETAAEQVADILNDDKSKKTFYFAKGGKDYYLCLASGRKQGLVRLYEGHNGQYECIESFPLQLIYYGEVMLYDGEYYYVLVEQNRYSELVDTIVIYKIGENMCENNVKIRYIPETYTWITPDDAVTLDNEELKKCIEEAKQEILDEKYVVRGQKQACSAIYHEDEDEIDFANINDKVKISRRLCKTASTYYGMYVSCKFTYGDNILSYMGYRSRYFNDRGNLMQIWFEEIDGTVYTFQLFSRPEYQYMMKVLKVEGKDIEVIWQEQAVPQRNFVIDEREVYQPS